MKALKYFIGALLVVAAIWSCTDEEFGSDMFVSSVEAPANVTALFNVSSDNTGTVGITPNSEGAISYEVQLGDDTAEAKTLKQGESVTHIYAEGSYDVKVVAIGVTGLKTEVIIPLVVSFKAPENLEVVISNDLAISKQVNVMATADFATSFNVYFGFEGEVEPLVANIGDTVSYIYEEAGIYTIKVVAVGAAIETAMYSEEFEVTAILQPLSPVATPPSRMETDVIAVFSGAYANVADTNLNPDWGQSTVYSEFVLEGDAMIQYSNLNYQGIAFGSTIDAASMEFLHIDVWTADAETLDIFPISEATGEKSVSKDLTLGEWTSFDIPLSEFTDQDLSMADLIQLKLVGAGTVFIDNIYFYREATSTSTVLAGTWKLAPEAGAFKVGPSYGNGDWWTSDAQAVIDRACVFDDTYVFGMDGSFKNEMGAETWLEAWQGTADACGTPVAPHDGSAVASYTHDLTGGKLTINGLGAHLALPKATNEGELPNVEVPSSITYDIVLSDNNNTMNLVIEAGAGVFWSFKLIRDNGAVESTPMEGVWKLLPDAGALKVGPSYGNGDWWTSDAQAVIDRACLFDDSYVFSSDGSFSNMLGADTWLEAWQGTADACGTPVAPHDGSVAGTYIYNAAEGTVTVNGTGAYLGLPKANNDGELPNVAVPASITYDVSFSDDQNTMFVVIEAGAGVFWSYEFVKEGTYTGGGSGGSTGGGTGSGTAPYAPVDFETTGNGADWTWTVFENDGNPSVEIVANPDASGINTSATVAKFTAKQNGQLWAGCETTHGEGIGAFTFDATNSIVKIMVYKSVISDVGLKFAESNGEAQPEVKVANTKINEWEELTFDLSGSIGKGITGIVDQLIVFPDFGARTGDNVIYFDNVTFGSN